MKGLFDAKQKADGKRLPVSDVLFLLQLTLKKDQFDVIKQNMICFYGVFLKIKTFYLDIFFLYLFHKNETEN